MSALHVYKMLGRPDKLLFMSGLYAAKRLQKSPVGFQNKDGYTVLVCTAVPL